MRELIRIEVAEPLNTDGIHPGRPPLGAPTTIAQIIHPQLNIPNPVFNAVAPRIAALEVSAVFGSMYFPGMKAVVRAIFRCWTASCRRPTGGHRTCLPARMYPGRSPTAADRRSALPPTELVAKLTGRLNMRPDRNLLIPLAPPRLPRPGHPGVLPASVTSASAGRSAGPSRRPGCRSASCTTDC